MSEAPTQPTARVVSADLETVVREHFDLDAGAEIDDLCILDGELSVTVLSGGTDGD